MRHSTPIECLPEPSCGFGDASFRGHPYGVPGFRRNRSAFVIQRGSSGQRQFTSDSGAASSCSNVIAFRSSPDQARGDSQTSDRLVQLRLQSDTPHNGHAAGQRVLRHVWQRGRCAACARCRQRSTLSAQLRLLRSARPRWCPGIIHPAETNGGVRSPLARTSARSASTSTR